MVINNTAKQQNTDVPSNEFTFHRNCLTCQKQPLLSKVIHLHLAHNTFICCTRFSISSPYYHKQHSVIGLYNRGALCSLKGMNTIFKYLLDETLASENVTSY